MKVYIVTQEFDFETSWTIGVYKSKKVAEKVKAECEKDEMCLDGAYVSEFELNEEVE